MNGWDTDGNWQQDSTTLTLEGGVPANKYGAMDIEQINTGAFAILELNSNLIPKGTELALPKGTHDIVITNKATQCIDRLMVEVVCNESPKVECDDFISKSSETHNIVLCEDVINFCVEIPMDQLGSYSIEHNGSIYTGDIAACADNPSAIQLTVGKGKHEFTFTNELTGCADEIVIKVNCMQVDGNKAPISKNNSIMGPVKGQSVKQSARILVANSDETRTMMNEAKVINILANDRAAKENSNIRIIEQPQLGTLEMNSDNSITYHPKENYCNAKRADYFRYEICNGEVCDEAEVKVYIDCTPIKVYTGVSPNQDGINDYFKIDGLEVYPQNELRIYNRFGKLLISKKNYKNDWDGRVNGKILPSGTYFYKLDDGNGKQYSGFLQLNR
jgi:gliding motility-associated-like protein